MNLRVFCRSAAWVVAGILALRGGSIAQDNGIELIVEQKLAESGAYHFEFLGDTGGITVRHLGAWHGCCLELSPEVSLEDGVLTIIEVDAGPPCLCPVIGWDLEIRFPGLPPGSYDIYLHDEREVLLATAQVTIPETETIVFTRGELNEDGDIDISDAIFLLQALFVGGPHPPCEDVADVNDDGTANVSDPIYLLAYLFRGEDPPPAPFPGSGEDPTEDEVVCPLENAVSAVNFARSGDVNGDGSVDISDGVALLNHILNGGPGPVCEDAADMDDDGALTLADVLIIHPDPIGPLDTPGPLVPRSSECGPDPTPDTLGCGFSDCPR